MRSTRRPSIERALVMVLAGFISAVGPVEAVIMVGNNSFGHPTDETPTRLEATGANILRTDLNGSVVIESDGLMPRILAPVSQSFTDVPFSHWAWQEIESLFQAGLTSGYPDGTYQPENAVTRAETAVFLMMGIHGASYIPPVPTGGHPFSDISGHWAEAWIEDLYEEGMTSGFPDGTYRPENQMTRAEMSIFLLKGKYGSSFTPPASGGGAFNDVAGHWAEDWIEQLKEEGITSGYPDGSYRPENPVSRAEMAVFIVNTFNLSLVGPPPTPVPDGNFYVALDGDDANQGTIEEPWRTLAPVHARNFLPGEVVYFERGGSWSGGLIINDSGTQGNPITFTAYGNGPKPSFSNPGGAGSHTRGISINADWVIVEDFLIQDTHEAGLYISEGSDHNTVRNIEATNVGFGITVFGEYNLITGNYFHDLHMVVNTPGGNDDYGAVAVDLNNGSHNEVSYNTMVNCRASSYDYGHDGGAVELFNDSDYNYIHHNWATTCDGFVEVGGGSARDTVIAYNVSVNNGSFATFHLAGVFSSTVKNFRIENNTIVETAVNNQSYEVLGFVGEPTQESVIVRNNIFWVERGSGQYGGLQRISDSSGFLHQNNVYHLVGGVALDFALGSGEVLADPVFVNLSNGDFHLRSASPAIDSGLDLGYSRDFDNQPVPSASSPDMGAFEFLP